MRPWACRWSSSPVASKDKEWFTKCMEEYVSDRDEMERIIAKLDDETLEKTVSALTKAIREWLKARP